MSFQVVTAPWALGADGQPAGDTIALEHVKEDLTLCLVYSTTLPLSLSAAEVMAIEHLKSCTSTKETS